MPTRKKRVHPLWVRVTHWVNFLALIFMVTSGVRIHNASPLWGFTLPTILQYGGLAYARQWHFFAMWIFFINGLVWLVMNLVTRHGRKTTLFRPDDRRGVLPMIRYYLRLDRTHPVQAKYNALQKLAYTSMIFVGVLAIASGIVLYWSVQFGALTWLLGGYDVARYLHFIAMAILVLFFLGHIFMVTISGWSNFVSMITGGKSETPHTTGEPSAALDHQIAEPATL